LGPWAETYEPNFRGRKGVLSKKIIDLFKLVAFSTLFIDLFKNFFKKVFYHDFKN
jgi:hypothetical protein